MLTRGRNDPYTDDIPSDNDHEFVHFGPSFCSAVGAMATRCFKI